MNPHTPFSFLQSITTYPNNPRVAKAVIAGKYNGLEVVENKFEMGVTNKSKEFLAKFPLGKVPAMETADGFTLFESGAMAYYGKEWTPCTCVCACFVVFLP